MSTRVDLKVFKWLEHLERLSEVRLIEKVYEYEVKGGGRGRGLVRGDQTEKKGVLYEVNGAKRCRGDVFLYRAVKEYVNNINGSVNV